MAHAMKHNKAACGHMFAHYDRAADNISNENIDSSRTHLNYNLAAELQTLSQGEFVKQRCSEVRCQNRKDVNVMCSWVLTQPDEIKDDESEKFFQESFDFLCQRYGKENVVSSWVHCDESKKHMHFAFVPVVYDKKKERYKVSAKEAIDRKDLQTFHQDLSEHLQKAFGRDVKVLNEATKDGNKTVSQLKQQTASERVKAAERQAEEAIKEANRLRELVRAPEEIEAIEGKKGLMGSRTLSEDDFKALKDTASALSVVNHDADVLFAAVHKLEKENEKLLQYKDKDFENQLKIAKLREENEYLLRLSEEKQKQLEEEELKRKKAVDAFQEMINAKRKAEEELRKQLLKQASEAWADYREARTLNEEYPGLFSDDYVRDALRDAKDASFDIKIHDLYKKIEETDFVLKTGNLAQQIEACESLLGSLNSNISVYKKLGNAVFELESIKELYEELDEDIPEGLEAAYEDKRVDLNHMTDKYLEHFDGMFACREEVRSQLEILNREYKRKHLYSYQEHKKMLKKEGKAF